MSHGSKKYQNPNLLEKRKVDSSRLVLIFLKSQPIKKSL
jgi:hypothetical protein